MNFNSLAYYLFLPASVIIYYWAKPSYRNIVLLILSYFFYMQWKAEYAILLFLSTFITYFCALFMEKGRPRERKFWLAVNIILNLSILFFFKYFNFSSHLLTTMLGYVAPDISVNFLTLDVLLPVGISFYTFQALGYTIDVYRNKVPTEKNFVDYAVFVSFFPPLVAGPIERSASLLPQLKKTYRFRCRHLHEGFLLILWGLFKKMVIADRLAVLVNHAYWPDFGVISAEGYMLAAIAFSFQIYCDFSAYSDIARGSARLLGIKLMDNFNAPYLSASVKAFWRRWHISLSSWFKDYLYIPLGGSRKGKLRQYFNLMAVFTVSGLWHGASLNFILWGMLNGFYQVAGDVLAALGKKWIKPLETPLFFKKLMRIVRHMLGVVFTFLLVTFAFIFFRVASIRTGLKIVGEIGTALLHFSALSFECITEMGLPEPYLWVMAGALTLLMLVDFMKKFINIPQRMSRTCGLKYVAYLLLIIVIVIFGYYGSEYDPQAFIYFQF